MMFYSRKSPRQKSNKNLQNYYFNQSFNLLLAKVILKLNLMNTKNCQSIT